MKTFKTIFLILILSCLLGCEQLQLNNQVFGDRSTKTTDVATSQSNLAEVAAPKIIKELAQELKQYRPQVEITEPQPEKTLNQTDVTVKLAVTDLPIFRDDRLGLGNHLNLIVDNQAVETIYSLAQPVILKNLAPGTHSIRVVAVSPWGESFKNQGAYAQTTFNVLTQTNANRPNQNAALLTYNSPTGTYSAEPILLDFYLSDGQGAIAPKNFTQNQWRIKATVNGTSFMIKDWQSYYLTGLQTGENWVKLELIDQMGKIIENSFNDTVRVFDYNPQQQDSLAKLVSNQISIEDAQGIVKQSYYIQSEETPEVAKSSQEKPEITEPKSAEKPKLVENASPTKPTPEEQKQEGLVNNQKLTTTSANNSQEDLTKISKQPVVISAPAIEPKDLEKTINDTPVIKSDRPLYEMLELPQTSSTSKQIISIQENNSDSFAPIAEIEIPQPQSIGMPSASVTVEPNKIAINIPSQETPTVPKSESETPTWWKKLLVGLRQQLEGLAKRLPSQV